MTKNEHFTFKLSAEERRALEQLAGYLQRSKGDSIRWLIRRAAAELDRPDEAAARPEAGEPA